MLHYRACMCSMDGVGQLLAQCVGLLTVLYVYVYVADSGVQTQS